MKMLLRRPLQLRRPLTQGGRGVAKHRCASGIEALTRCASGLGRPDAFFSLINRLVLTALPILLITRHAVQPLNVSIATL